MTAGTAVPGGDRSEVLRYFLRLGCVAFGGPAAHIAILRRELVSQRKWLDDEQFADLLGAANLIPGPNSTEMAMHLGALRAGRAGLWLAGLAFIGPAVAIVLALAWLYVRWGTTAPGEAIAWGIRPVILAIILQAIWGLRRTVVKAADVTVLSIAALGAIALGVNELLVLLGTGLAVLGWRQRRALRSRLQSGAAVLLPITLSTQQASLSELFLVFLKIGGLLYGSGYVLIAFLESEFVVQRGWLTRQELIDAVAAGQFTPGPLFSSATFVGYLIDGWFGALLATVGIFLPSFLFVVLTHPLVPRIRGSRWASGFLDGVNAAAVVLMATTGLSLAKESLDDVSAAVVFAAAGIWIVWRSPSTVLVVGAGLVAGLGRWWALS